MEEVKVEIEGINAVFANARELNSLRKARPELFDYRQGILMLIGDGGSLYRVVLPIAEEDLVGIVQR